MDVIVPERKQKKPGWFSLYKAEIEGYGFTYSFKEFLTSMLIVLSSFILVGFAFKLTPMFIGGIAAFVALMLPIILKAHYRYVFEQRRFQEVKTYMDTMAHSFKMKPKILNALNDTLEVAEIKYPNLAIHIKEAIEIIHMSKTNNVYRDALREIQKHYECSRISSFHEFMIDVELQGGKYDKSLQILIDDMAGWEQRTYLYQTDRRDIKRKILLSLIISTCVCATTLFMLPSTMDITTSPIYQFSTTITLIMFVCIYTYTQTSMNGSWLENDGKIDLKQMDKDYEVLKNINQERVNKKTKTLKIAISPLIIMGVLIQNVAVVILGVLLIFYIQYMPANKKKYAKRRITRSLQKEIPTWCRKIALRLHTDNVQVAIMKSYEQCAPVLKKPLEQLIQDFEIYPDSIIPYDNFLSEFDIPEANRMMKTLYSISKQGTKDSDTQVNVIIEQNNAMLSKAEDIKNEDSIAGSSMLFLAPMLFGSIKMLVDLFLFCMSFLSLSGGMM